MTMKSYPPVYQPHRPNRLEELCQKVDQHTVYPKKYAHGFCFAVLCCGYALTDFPISIRLTSLALWQSNDCPSASKATLMNMDKYLMWIHYERLHNHNKAKHNKTVCIFLGIYYKWLVKTPQWHQKPQEQLSQILKRPCRIPSWVSKPGTREFHANKFNPVFSKEVRFLPSGV